MDEEKVNQAIELEKQKMLANLSGIKEEPSPLSENGQKVPVEPPKVELTHQGQEAISNLVKDGLEAGAIHSMTDPKFQQQISDKAKGFIQSGINKVGNQLAKDEQDTAYDAKAEACENCGISKGSPKWCINQADIEDGFWKEVCLIIAFFTVCPINNLSKMFKKFIRISWVTILLAILIVLGLYTGAITWIVKLITKGG
jgi:hypothetical protein